MKPVQQVFALVLENIPEFKNKQGIFEKRIEGYKKTLKDDHEKYQKKETDMRHKEVSDIIFGESVRKCDNKKSGNHNITDFFIMPI
tara:strand:- start:360 stop:617 length:258 start_codon:yes stop_codon:yes gene_type:complete